MGEVRFMISEAAKQVKVESHVLRYWEEELSLKIGRTEMGHRYYTEEDIQLFCCIKKLKNEGVLLKDLKPLVPDLLASRIKKQDVSDTVDTEELCDKKQESASNHALAASPNHPSESVTAAELAVVPAEVIPFTQFEQVRSAIGDVLTEVVAANNHILKKDICVQVTHDIVKEMDFLFQAKDRREEEHFRKLDTLIRQQQASRREAARDTPLGRLRKIFT